jgi:DnaJ-class molecular chaperone
MEEIQEREAKLLDENRRIQSGENIEDDFFPKVTSLFNKTNSLNNFNKINEKKKVKILHNKPDDIIYNINVSLADIYNLVKKNITISRFRKVDGKYIQKKKKIQIPIYGKEILLENEGDQLKNYKERGNIIINIFNDPFDNFKRINEYDILTYKDVYINQLYSSFIYDIILPHGELLKVQSEPIINKKSSYLLQKIIKKGLPYENESNEILYGNLYIVYKIIFPKSLADLKNIEEYKESSSINDEYQIAYNCLFDEILKNE